MEKKTIIIIIIIPPCKWMCSFELHYWDNNLRKKVAKNSTSDQHIMQWDKNFHDDPHQTDQLAVVTRSEAYIRVNAQPITSKKFRRNAHLQALGISYCLKTHLKLTDSRIRTKHVHTNILLSIMVKRHPVDAEGINASKLWKSSN